MCHPLQPHSSAVAAGLGRAVLLPERREEPWVRWKGSGAHSDLLRPSPGPCVLTKSRLMATWQLLWLQCSVLLCSIMLSAIFPIQTTMREGRKFPSAFRLLFTPTKGGLREGHAVAPSQPLLGCWEEQILTPAKCPAFLPSIYAAAF